MRISEALIKHNVLILLGDQPHTSHVYIHTLFSGGSGDNVEQLHTKLKDGGTDTLSLKRMSVNLIYAPSV